MAKIKVLKQQTSSGGTEKVYPITSSKAVLLENGTSVDAKITSIESTNTAQATSIANNASAISALGTRVTTAEGTITTHTTQIASKASQSDLNDLSLQVSGKVAKKGSIDKVQNLADASLFTSYNRSVVSVSLSNGGAYCVQLQDGRTTNFTYIQKLPEDLVKTIVGHKYLISMRLSYNDISVLRAEWYHKGTSSSSFVGWKIVTASYTDYQLRVWQAIPDEADGYTFYPQVHDLTEMFGGGNEPTTATEFAQALGYDSIDDVPYIPYSASAITMPNASSMSGLLTQKVMASEVCLGEYTLRCNGSSLVAVDSSGNETTLSGGASTTSLDDATE